MLEILEVTDLALVVCLSVGNERQSSPGFDQRPVTEAYVFNMGFKQA